MQKKILIINIFGLGDVLFTTPLINNLKLNFPESYIAYIANKRAAPVLLTNPKVNKVFVYERDDFLVLSKKSKLEFIQKFLFFLKSIKQEQFDLSIDLSLNSFMNTITWLAGIKERAGYNYKNRSFFLTKKISLDSYENRHVVDYYLDLLKKLSYRIENSKLELNLTEEDRSWAKKILKENNIGSKDTVVGIMPGGGASWGKDAQYKRWAVENYAKLADKIIENSSVKLILL